MSLEREKGGRKGGKGRKEGRKEGRTESLPGLQTAVMKGHSKKAAVCKPGREPNLARTLISRLQLPEL